MKTIDNEVKIFWLSDIHFKSSYTKDAKYKELNSYISSFHEYIKSIKYLVDYDYILLSGDIAQSGEKSEYDLFKERILKGLKTVFPKAKLIVVPGNHDVNRLEAKNLNKFIEQINFKNRRDFLNEEKDDFIKVFNNYSEAFKNDDSIPPDGINSNLKRNKLLYGYVLNRDKKFLFIILNSAWYSFGAGFLEYCLDQGMFNFDGEEEEIERIQKKLDEHFKNNLIAWDNFNGFLTGFLKKYAYIRSEKEIEKFLSQKIIPLKINKDEFLIKLKELSRKIVKFKKKRISKEIENIANEYGKQLVGLDVFNEELAKIKELFSTYNDYVVTTVMHHPTNWLDFRERVPYKNKEKKISSFHTVKDFTDLLLTGHEHVPQWHKTEMINDNQLLHIQAGCFMYASNPASFKAIDNWFSTLSINTNKRTVQQTKHYYKDKNWYSKNMLPNRLNKKHDSILSVNRKLEISSKQIDYSKLITKSLKVEELSFNYYKSGSTIFKIVKESSKDDFGLRFDELKELIDTEKTNKVCFLFLDILHDLYDKYMENDKMLVLEEIKNDFDFKFDNFRYRFFSSLTEKEVLKYKRLKFISIVKPYWEIETCLKN